MATPLQVIEERRGGQISPLRSAWTCRTWTIFASVVFYVGALVVGHVVDAFAVITIGRAVFGRLKQKADL